MEEILSSIKRIIAEEGEEAVRAATPRAPRRGRASSSETEPALAPMAEADEVLELTDELDMEEAMEVLSAPAAPEPEPIAAPTFTPSFTPPPVPATDPMLSVESEVAARQSLSALSSMLIKPQDGGDNTLDALVRELLRPILKQWLDANLPDMVEAMVAKEIARITGRPL